MGAEARIAPGMTVTEAIHRANKIAHRCAYVRPHTCRDCSQPRRLQGGPQRLSEPTQPTRLPQAIHGASNVSYRCNRSGAFNCACTPTAVSTSTGRVSGCHVGPRPDQSSS